MLACATKPLPTSTPCAADRRVPSCRPELVYRGRPLLDDRQMSAYELGAASVLHAFRRPADALGGEGAGRSRGVRGREE